MRTILLIDDDVDDNLIFQDALTQVDPTCQLITLTNCRDAILMVSDPLFIPDFIFLDLNLPGITGRECLVELKKSKHLKHTPIIIYTTSQSPIDKEQTKRAGASLFLTKPDSYDKLCSAIKEILSNPSNLSTQQSAEIPL